MSSVALTELKGADVIKSKTAESQLSNEQTAELLQLLKGADSVELKLTVPESDQRSAILALGMDPLEAQIRQVFFFDTADLALQKNGLVVRARRVQGKGGDSVVKIRPITPDELPDPWRSSKNMVVEVDAMPGGFVCSASMKGATTQAAPREVAAGYRPIRKLFSQEQRRFFREYAPAHLDLDALSVLGPITVFKLRFSPDGYARRMVAELWMYPDYSRILELSTKCAPREALEVAAGARQFLASRGIDASAEQETKTKRAMEYFAAAQATTPE
jgi:hypothetical protein